MISRRALLRAGAGVGVGLVAGGCAGSDRRSDPTATTTTTSNPPPSTRVTTTSTASTPPTPAPWAQADFAALDAFIAETNGAAFLIVDHGRLVHEWYRDGDAGFRRDVASAQKSVVALLVGRAVDDGLVTLDTPIVDVLGPEWTPGGPAPGVVVSQLLSMTSGLDHEFREVAAPGERWQYSNAFARLADVLQAVTGTEFDELARAWLFEPSGATTATFRARPSARAVAPFGLVASAPDLAAIGGLVLAGGGGSVSTAWIDAALAPSQPLNPSYGYLWWLNGQPSHRLPGADPPLVPGPIMPSAPADVVAALGKDDQKLYLSRALQLIVVRLGDRAVPASSEALSGFDDELWTRLVDARG